MCTYHPKCARKCSRPAVNIISYQDIIMALQNSKKITPMKIDKVQNLLWRQDYKNLGHTRKFCETVEKHVLEPNSEK